MASSVESNCALTLCNAFTGIGVDERLLITTLVKYRQNKHKSPIEINRRGLLIKDDGNFEAAAVRFGTLFKEEILRFENAVMMWVMNPCERDARLLRDALMRGPEAYDIIIEVACTRSSDELLGARKAYHSLFHRSVEEDVADNVDVEVGKLLLALVSSYRYEGPRVSEEIARSEAETLWSAIKEAEKRTPSELDGVVNVVAVRSKPHLKALCNHFFEISGSSIYDALDIDSTLKKTTQCLCNPETYFSFVLGEVLNEPSKSEESNKQAITRVMVTQAGEGMEAIRNQYYKLHGTSLSDHIQERVRGNYRDFLLELLAA